MKEMDSVQSKRVELPGEVQQQEEKEHQEKQEEQKKEKENSLFPQAFITSPAEFHLLSLTQNFQRQFFHLHPDRRPLLLSPRNECGVRKFVCTTVRPTPPLLPQLLSWEGCASFVADFLLHQPLNPPEELPPSLASPPTVLRRGSASCLESSVLLCCLLLGADYDAYCVSGYAVRGTCEGDRSLKDCPLLDAEEQSGVLERQEPENKYRAISVREPRSRFLIGRETKRRDAEEEKLQEQEAGPPEPADPLNGLRVHCWVLVRSETQGVQEEFFIDPVTGSRHLTDSQEFLGIESVWNHLNYYVNMQDCRGRCKDMLFDLDDPARWESLLCDGISRTQLVLDVQNKKETLSRGSSEEEEEEKEQEEEQEEEQLTGLDLPISWITPFTVTETDLQRRPGGQTHVVFRDVEVETFSPSSRTDGLLRRVCNHQQGKEVCVYQHRNDHLEQRLTNINEQTTTEHFRAGRHLNLLSYRCVSLGGVWEREAVFGPARVDDLVRRVMTSQEMMETFDGRSDFLHLRHVFFSEPRDDITDLQQRPVQRVVEHFHRNRCKPANQDVRERVLVLQDRRIQLTFHCGEGRLIQNTQTFTKPRESTETTKTQRFTRDLETSFQVDVCMQPPQTHTLYKMLQCLMKEEEQVLKEISQSLEEMKELESCRQQEELQLELHTTNTERTLTRTQHMLQECVAAEELKEEEEDVLAPLLLRLGWRSPLSADEARRLHSDCLSELKEQMVQEAQLLQERLQQVTVEIQEKQVWYQKNQVSPSELQRKELQDFMSQKTLQLRATHRRLRMLRETSSDKINTVDQKLRLDARLSAHLLS